jgi:hypothetical protein
VAGTRHVTSLTPLAIYTHLFADDDASGDMAALGALATGPKADYGNVIRLHG